MKEAVVVSALKRLARPHGNLRIGRMTLRHRYKEAFQGCLVQDGGWKMFWDVRSRIGPGLNLREWWP
jgi:hypothetical protein